MKPNQLSAGKRLTKPVLFGSLIAGLAVAFFNRHLFFQDVSELREKERAKNEARRAEVLERRQRQREEVEEQRKKQQQAEGGQR